MVCAWHSLFRVHSIYSHDWWTKTCILDRELGPQNRFHSLVEQFLLLTDWESSTHYSITNEQWERPAHIVSSRFSSLKLKFVRSEITEDFSHSVRLEKIFTKVCGYRQRTPNIPRLVCCKWFSPFFSPFCQAEEGERGVTLGFRKGCFVLLDTARFEDEFYCGEGGVCRRNEDRLTGYYMTNRSRLTLLNGKQPDFSTTDSAPNKTASAHICLITPRTNWIAMHVFRPALQRCQLHAKILSSSNMFIYWRGEGDVSSE